MESRDVEAPCGTPARTTGEAQQSRLREGSWRQKPPPEAGAPQEREAGRLPWGREGPGEPSQQTVVFPTHSPVLS